MYYKLNNDVFFRDYGEVGYITSTGLFTDRTVNKSGAVFLSSLARSPKSIEALSEEIAAHFTDVDAVSIKRDIINFFESFIEDGFIVCGETPKKAVENATGFTYNVVEPQTMKQDFTPEKLRAKPSTQDTLDSFSYVNQSLHLFRSSLRAAATNAASIAISRTSSKTASFQMSYIIAFSTNYKNSEPGILRSLAVSR